MHSDGFTYIPLKINLSDVIPTIFANAILLIPVSIVDFYKGHAAFSDFIFKLFYGKQSNLYYSLLSAYSVF